MTPLLWTFKNSFRPAFVMLVFVLATSSASAGGREAAAPGQLEMIKTGFSKVHIAWSPPADSLDAAEYNVFRDGAFVASVGETVFHDRDLAPGTIYTYTVNAFDHSGSQSPFSKPLTIRTLRPLTSLENGRGLQQSHKQDQGRGRRH